MHSLTININQKAITGDPFSLILLYPVCEGVFIIQIDNEWHPLGDSLWLDFPVQDSHIFINHRRIFYGNKFKCTTTSHSPLSESNLWPRWWILLLNKNGSLLMAYYCCIEHHELAMEIEGALLISRDPWIHGCTHGTGGLLDVSPKIIKFDS